METATSFPDSENNDALKSLLAVLKPNADTCDMSSAKLMGHSSEVGKLGGRMADSCSLDELKGFFHLPLNEAAKTLGICTTLLKKVCRKHNIRRWPYRQIQSIISSIQSAEAASRREDLDEATKEKYMEHISTLQNNLNLVINDPNTPVVGVTCMPGGVLADEDLEDLVEGLAASGSNSTQGRPTRRRKRRAPTHGSLKSFGKSMHTDSDSAGISSRPSSRDCDKACSGVAVGDTVVKCELSEYRQGEGTVGVTYVGPVTLAPLRRRRMGLSSTKKTISLLEPDICGHSVTEFLPVSVIRLSPTHVTDSVERS